MCIITEICGHAANSREAFCAQAGQNLATDKDRTGETEWNLRAKKIRDDFRSKGISISDWSIANGFPPNLVYYVLAGRRNPTRGRTHCIAVKLGLKRGEIVQEQDIATAINA